MKVCIIQPSKVLLVCMYVCMCVYLCSLSLDQGSHFQERYAVEDQFDDVRRLAQLLQLIQIVGFDGPHSSLGLCECMHVCMYVCMYVRICIYVCMWLPSKKGCALARSSSASAFSPAIRFASAIHTSLIFATESAVCMHVCMYVCMNVLYLWESTS